MFAVSQPPGQGCDSFDFTQAVNGATHKQGHTGLDLVFLHGISNPELEILELSFSDRMPVIFTCLLANEVSKTKRSPQQLVFQLFI